MLNAGFLFVWISLYFVLQFSCCLCGVFSALLRNWDIVGRVHILKQWDIHRSRCLLNHKHLSLALLFCQLLVCSSACCWLSSSLNDVSSLLVAVHSLSAVDLALYLAVCLPLSCFKHVWHRFIGCLSLLCGAVHGLFLFLPISSAFCRLEICNILPGDLRCCLLEVCIIASGD